jgi:RND family efflux transporter MFP subunit
MASAAVMGGCVNRDAQKQAKQTQQILSNPTLPVQTEAVKYQSLAETLDITGDLTTAQDVQVGPKVGGRVVLVMVRDGDAVSAGEVIAEQDSTQQLSNLQQALAAVRNAQSQYSQAVANAAIGPSKTAAAVSGAQAQVRSAQASLKKALAGARTEERLQAEWQVKAAKTNLDTAQKDLERIKTLVDEGAVPRQQLDQAQNTFAAAQAQYNAALQSQNIVLNQTRPEDIEVAREAVRQAQEALAGAKAQQKLDVLYNDQVQSAQATIQSAQAQVQIAQQALDDTKIRAPFAGKISGKPIQAGTVLSAGEPVARIVGNSGIYFEGQVPEEQVARVGVGRPVQVRIDAVNAVLQGHVAAVNPLGADVGRIFTVRVQLDGNLAGIKSGMFARGEVTLRVLPNVVVVPSAAVLQRNNQNLVFVVDNGKAKSVNVTLGVRKQDMVEVKGLTPGQDVVISGQQGLSDGTPVDAQPSQAAMKSTDQTGI